MPAVSRSVDFSEIQTLLGNLAGRLEQVPQPQRAGIEAEVHALSERVERLLRDQAEGTETLLEAAFEYLPIGVAVLAGPEPVYRYCNAAHRAILPDPGADPVGRPAAEVWQGDPGPPFSPGLVRAVIETGQTLSGEEVAVDTPAGRRYISYHAGRFHEQAGPAGMLLAWDLTDLVTTRAELRRRAAAFESIFNAINDTVLVFDNDGRVARANPAALQNAGMSLLGLNREQIGAALGITLQDGTPVPWEDLPSSRALTGEHMSHMPLRFRPPGGREMNVLASARPLLGEGGQVVGAVAIWHDVTALQEVRSAAELERDRLKTLVESMNDEVWFVDAAGNVVLMNDRAVPNLGLESAGEINGPLIEINRAELEIYYPDGTPRPPEEGPLFYALRGESRRGQEIIRNRATGELMHREYIANPIRSLDGQVVGAVGVIRDMTEQRRTQIALEEVNRRLEEANRQLRDFAFIASHDLQEPVRKIRFFGEILRERYGEALGVEGQDYLARMLVAGERMGEMVAGLLSYSRVNTQAQPFGPVDLRQAALEALSDLEARVAETGARVAVADLPVIHADALQIRELLLNLIANAIKFHKPGQPPVVRVRAEPGEGGTLRLVVEDEGIGFDMEHAERIFQPFERLHGRVEYEGSGMGLAICRKIAERHRGTIAVESSPGQGARFTVILPERPG